MCIERDVQEFSVYSLIALRACEDKSELVNHPHFRGNEVCKAPGPYRENT